MKGNGSCAGPSFGLGSQNNGGNIGPHAMAIDGQPLNLHNQPDRY